MTGDLTVSGSCTATSFEGDGSALTGVGDITAVSLTGDSGGALTVSTGSAGFSVLGGAGMTSSGTGTTITIAGNDAGADGATKGIAAFNSSDFSASSGVISLADITTAHIASGSLDTDLSSVSGSDDTLASAKAIKTAIDLAGDASMSAAVTTDNVIVTTDGTSGKNIQQANASISTGGQKLGVGIADPLTALSVVHDYATTTWDSQLTDGQGGGDVILLGGGTTIAGLSYCLLSNTTWGPTDANVAGLSTGLLAMSVGTDPDADGMLLRGFFRIASTYVDGTPVVGQPVFLSETSAYVTFTAPTTSGAIVRVIGHCVGTDSGDVFLYFNPDPTWVEVA